MNQWDCKRNLYRADLPDARVVALRNIFDEMYRSPRSCHTQGSRHEDSRIQRSCIEPLNGVVRESIRPVSVMN